MKSVQLTQPQMDRAVEQAICSAANCLNAGGSPENAKKAAVAIVEAAKAAAAALWVEPDAAEQS